MADSTITIRVLFGLDDSSARHAEIMGALSVLTTEIRTMSDNTVSRLKAVEAEIDAGVVKQAADAARLTDLVAQLKQAGDDKAARDAAVAELEQHAAKLQADASNTAAPGTDTTGGATAGSTVQPAPAAPVATDPAPPVVPATPATPVVTDPSATPPAPGGTATASTGDVIPSPPGTAAGTAAPGIPAEPVPAAPADTTAAGASTTGA